MKTCNHCGKRLYARNRSGHCAPCRMRQINQSKELVGRQQARRLATLYAQSVADRVARFQVRNGPDECWGWTGCHNGIGYAKITYRKRQTLVTHLALEMDGRPRPSGDHVACHSCDNPICTNPAHLWWGTEKENMQDAAAKGRLRKRAA